MFKWLFGRGTPEPSKQADTGTEQGRFGRAHQMVLERAAALKKEYERTRDDPEVTKNVERYKDPAYIAGARDAIFLAARNPQHSAAFEILPVVATMFMTMASEVFPSLSGFESFSYWANAYSPIQRRELVRFAYLATVWEQQQAGETHPVAFASRVILMTLAANANGDSISKDVARELLAYVDRVWSKQKPSL